MEIKAKVNVINEVRKGVSQTNGHEWQSQDVIISWKEQSADGREREQLLQVTLHGESIERLAALNPVVNETEITGRLDFRTRSYNNKVYNEISLIL